MSVTLIFHLERADDEIVWWAESPDVPGLSAAADTLAECRKLAMSGLLFDGLSVSSVVEVLAGASLDAASSIRTLQPV